MNIIELAKQAGLKRHQEQAPGIDGVVGSWAELKAFANLVEAAARADEREACAKVCEEVGQWPSLGPKDCAYAIRERGTT